jgi:RND family efflux transporter MFP subunit
MELSRAFLILGSIPILLLAGCNKTGKETPAQTKPLVVNVVKPLLASIHREVRQPGYIEAWEQAAIFPKIPGYVEKWHVDIDDKVAKDKVLAELYVPEMVEELKLKAAAVKQAKETLEVAKARIRTATAWTEEAQAGLQRAQANQRRWQLEYERISKLTGVIDKQIKEETQNQLESATAGWKEVQKKVESAQAVLKESEAQKNKAQADIAVAEADHRRMAALVDYANIKAPFKGVITRRNINTGDFVQPPTAGKGEPLFVLQSRDVIRVFVDVPETDASWVAKGAKAKVTIQALKGQVFSGTVARTSYALDRAARTLQAEIDLDNPKDLLRPGMYAFTTITAESPKVLTIPAAAVVTQGDVTQGYQSYCYVLENDKARRTFLQVGIRDDQRVEVLKKKTRDANKKEQWVELSREERIVLGDLSSLTEGKTVEVSEKK